MAHSVLPCHFRDGFRQPATEPHWTIRDEDDGITYEPPPSSEIVTSSVHNDLGINVLRTWPTLYDGTASPHGIPEWWNPPSKVDVLIVGAGPSGLEIALSLVRQGLTFRIIDKAPHPLIAGRADGVQPRFLETLATWGLSKEVAEEGPIIERTAIYYNGKLLHHGRSHQSDSRYRGLHVITQGQIERIYVRDLLRHRMLVERNTTLKEFPVDTELSKTKSPNAYPVRAEIENSVSGKLENIEAKYLVGSDGASSSIRKRLGIPFDGVSTNIYWGIMDCVFETDYPHAWIFGSVVSSEHGGCVIIPRENGYIRLYTQLDVSATGSLAQSRQERVATFAEAGEQVDIHSITPEEVLEQANRVFSPYKLKFGAPLSWFAFWKISERVARSFSSDDLRVHLAGDAAHVHSVMGAFGLNASILDAANLAWKLGMSVKNQAQANKLMRTYDQERRLHAAHIIETSGKYLRFVCSSALPTARLYHLGADLSINGLPGFEKFISASESQPNSTNHHSGDKKSNGMLTNGTNGINSINGTNGVNGMNGTTQNGADGAEQHSTYSKKIYFESPKKAKEFIHQFFAQHGPFLLGVDSPYGISCLNPGETTGSAVRVRNGVRAPNPRVCFDTSHTGYLYDKFKGSSRFHLVVFGWDALGVVRQQLIKFSQALSSSASDSFFNRFGGRELFDIVFVVKGVPWQVEKQLATDAAIVDLKQHSTVVFDDRAPDEDVHNTWGVNNRTGVVVVVRPDLWVGFSCAPQDVDALNGYFDGFLVPK